MKYILLILSLFLLSCEDKEFNAYRITKKKVKTYTGPSSVHYNFAQYAYDRGTNKPKVIVKGEIAKIFRHKSEIHLTKATIFYRKYYAKKAKKKERRVKLTQLTCDRAIIYERKKLFIGEGNVVVISRNGIRLETKKIYYDERENKLYTDPQERVVIYNKNGTITRGIYLRTDPGFNKIMLDRKQTTTPETKKKKQAMGAS